MKTLALTLALAAVAAGCSKDCTLIGCNDSLRVTFGTRTVSPPYSLAVIADGVPTMYECNERGVLSPPFEAGNGTCDATGFTMPATPRMVMVTVRPYVDGGVGATRTVTATPPYTQVRPNGEGCDPVCRQSVVTVP